jgi:hypothetical protein
MTLNKASTLILTLLALGPAASAQSPNDTKVIKRVPFPGRSDLVAAFTIKPIPLTEPPLPMAKIGVVVLDAAGNQLTSWNEKDDTTGFFANDVVRIRNRPLVLLGARLVDGGEYCMYALALDGHELKPIHEWRGSQFDYQVTPAGDLKVTVTRPRFDILPQVLIWNGADEHADLAARRALIEQIAIKATVDVEDSEPHQELLRRGISLASRVRHDCEVIIAAEVVLGNFNQALKVCAVARKKIEAFWTSECPPGQPNCLADARASDLRHFDHLVETAITNEEQRQFKKEDRIR